MKAMLRVAVAVLVVGAFAVSAVAQITITQADVANILTPGRTLINRTDNQTSSMNIGNPGSSSWDFSGLVTSTFQVYNAVAAAGTPHIADFPGATNAFRVDTTLQGISGSVYQYLQVNASGLRNLGNKARAVPFPGAELVLKTTVTPAEIVYGLPSTLGTTWMTAFSNNVRITLNGQELSNTTTGHNATYTVDAYGPMTLPSGLGTHQALRIRKMNLYTNTQGQSGWVLSYLFIAANGAAVQVEATDTLQGSSGTIGIVPAKTSWNGPVVTTDVRIGDGTPSAYTLHQNYPNPFNPSTTITYEVPRLGQVTLKVFNLLGQEVATLVNDVKAPGVYSMKWTAEGIPSGVYFYKMQSSSVSITRRMLLVR